VGAEICRRLTGRGAKVRALIRPTSSPDKLAFLRECGADLCVGDLKEPASLDGACEGVDAVISTASSTLSRQAGDSIESVDSQGQVNLVGAAKAAHIDRFVFVSFRRHAGISSPLGDAKARVETAIQELNFTTIQASWFMEVWLSPMLGFDYPNAAARIYGPGTSPISWVSYRDVAEMCCVALTHRAAEHRTIEFGGPEPLSPLEVVARFEGIEGRPFKLEHIPEEALRAQLAEAKDSMQKSFAALTLGYLLGDAMKMAPIQEEFGLKLTSIDDYARAVLGKGVPV
jgi:uncharacterized protein YbjT (DUF2867 family)